MDIKKLLSCITFSFLFLLSVASCQTVKEYQKSYLNDEEMKLEDRKAQIFESNFHTYREGAVGGTSGKSGSGCGCN